MVWSIYYFSKGIIVMPLDAFAQWGGNIWNLLRVAVDIGLNRWLWLPNRCSYRPQSRDVALSTGLVSLMLPCVCLGPFRSQVQVSLECLTYPLSIWKTPLLTYHLHSYPIPSIDGDLDRRHHFVVLSGEAPKPSHDPTIYFDMWLWRWE